MLIIPAIDLKDGACVRLVKGELQNKTVYSADPLAMARQWKAKGAQRIHVVDLDGAFSGTPRYLELAAQMRKETGCEIEFGGGLRSAAAVEKALALGIDKLILGTSALTDPSWIGPLVKKQPQRFIVGLDAKSGMVATKGWVETSQVSMPEALGRMEALGFEETIFTDISRDGAMAGPNLEAMAQVVKGTKMGVYASGGVTKLEDIKALAKISGLRGAIVGKALYDGKLQLEDCFAAASS